MCDFQVWLTADGEVAVFHDGTFQRTVGPRVYEEGADHCVFLVIWTLFCNVFTQNRCILAENCGHVMCNWQHAESVEKAGHVNKLSSGDLQRCTTSNPRHNMISGDCFVRLLVSTDTMVLQRMSDGHQQGAGQVIFNSHHDSRLIFDCKIGRFSIAKLGGFLMATNDDRRPSAISGRGLG